MDDSEDRKRNPRRAPSSQLDEPDPDLGLAMSLQERREVEFAPLPTIESDEEGTEDFEDDDNDDEDDYEFNAEDYEYFSSRGIEGDFGLLEGEDSSSYYGMEEEDEIDPDNMSYEQLIELGEIIGEEKRGLSADQVSSCLQPFTWYESVHLKVVAGIDRCVVCQVEFTEGEVLAALPCEHPYHSDCISRWLQVKKTCPICSTEVVSTQNATGKI